MPFVGLYIIVATFSLLGCLFLDDGKSIVGKFVSSALWPLTVVLGLITSATGDDNAS